MMKRIPCETNGPTAGPRLRFLPRYVSVLLVATFAGAGLVACATDDAESDAPVGAISASEEGSATSVAEASTLDERGDTTGTRDPEPVTEPSLPPLPPQVEVAMGTSAGLAGPTGGSLRAGGLSLSIPEGALSGPVEFSLELVDGVEALERRWVGGLPLATARVRPWNPEFTRAVHVTFPLNRALEPGTRLEVLAWQPAMRSYIVAGRGRVDDSGTQVTFPLRQLGEMVVRPEPVQRAVEETLCDHPTLRLHERWPGAAEAAVVGLVEVEERMDRGVAFNVLSDARLLSYFRSVDFKNEEVNDSLATRRNELAHRDEDFLFDPNASAAVEVLAELVSQEWHCPLTGESAYQVRITEGFDSLIEHSVRSTHYQGRGVDLTLSPVPAAAGDERRAFYGRLSSLAVCAGFDYVHFENLAHAHVSVVPTRWALLVRDADGLAVVEGRIGAPADTRRRLDAVNVPAGHVLAWTGEHPSLLPAPRREQLPAGDALRFVSSASSGAAVAPDLLKQIVVQDGRAWLANSVPVPPPGSAPIAPSTVDIAYPWALDVDLAGAEVLDATFQVHVRTAEARERLRGR